MNLGQMQVVCSRQAEKEIDQMPDQGTLAEPPGKDCRWKIRHEKTQRQRGSVFVPKCVVLQSKAFSRVGLQWAFSFHANLFLIDDLPFKSK